jgi:N-acetylmuramoyl-L-alanine amidase
MTLLFKNKYLLIIISALLLAGCASQSASMKMDPALQREVISLNNTPYLPLTRICDVYDLNWKWDPYVKTATIERKGKIVLMEGSRRMLVNGSEVELDRPVLLSQGAVYVPTSFIKSGLVHIVDSLYVSNLQEKAPPEAPNKKFTIRSVILDPGHGGKDPGAIGARLHLKERNLTLAVAKKLREELESQGINVSMTRDTDVFVPLPKRTDMANKSGVDLFISVHINAARTRLLNGFECYYLSEATDDNARATEALENSSLQLGDVAATAHSSGVDKALWDLTLTENRRESAMLASYICKSVEANMEIRNRGIRTARFFVLKGTRMPAVLLEMGYISNIAEERKMSDNAYWDRMVDAVAKGIIRYKNEYERTEGFTN